MDLKTQNHFPAMAKEPRTPVIFYLEKDGDVFAYFPEEKYDINGIYRSSYAHIGQHSACHPDYVKDKQKATLPECRELARELTNLGYNLEILNSASPCIK